MIWESAPLAETATRLRELGIEIAVFDPAANVPERGDLLSVMRQNAEELARIGGDE